MIGMRVSVERVTAVRTAFLLNPRQRNALARRKSTLHDRHLLCLLPTTSPGARPVILVRTVLNTSA
jgi:hypothetical protein